MADDEESAEGRRTRADRLADAPILLWVIMAVVAIFVVAALFLVILERPAL